MARLAHRALLCLLLATVATWLGYATLLTRAPLVIAECLLALFALGAALRASHLTRYPVALLAMGLSAEWLISVILSVRIGYFEHQRTITVVRALAPGVLMEVLALYAIVVAVAFYPAGRRDAVRGPG